MANTELGRVLGCGGSRLRFDRGLSGLLRGLRAILGLFVLVATARFRGGLAFGLTGGFLGGF